MLCPQCGTQLAEGAQSCPTCGTQFVAQTAAGTSAAPPPPPNYTPQMPAPTGQPVQPAAAPVQQAAAPAPAPVPQPDAQPVPTQPTTQQPIAAPATEPQPEATQMPAPAPTGQPTAPVQTYTPPAAPDQTPSYAAAPDQQPAYSAVPGQPSGFAPQPAPTPTPGQAPKKNRKPLFIGLAAVLVVLIGIGIFAGVSIYQENQRSEAYAQALSMMNNEDYVAAYDGFTALGDYQDSEEKAAYCSQGIDYQNALQLYEGKDYEGALSAFTALGNFSDSADLAVECQGWLDFNEAVALTDQGKFEEAAAMNTDFSGVLAVTSDPAYSQWQKRNSYGIADQSFAAGHFYTAYNQFSALSGYEDADARAQACIQATPGNVEFYHDLGFVSSSTDLVFEAGAATLPNYVKVYSGDTLVSTLWVNPGGSTTIQIPAGDYTMKSGTGELWFGETDMFGIDGYYDVMLFDGGNEVVHLDDNKIYTITLYMEGEGNVGNRSVNPENF